MTWLLEERMPILLVGASATVIMVLVVIFVRRLPALLGLIGVILLTGLLLLVELLIVTEVETIENMLYEGAESLERNDIPAALAHISPASEPIRQQRGPDATQQQRHKIRYERRYGRDRTPALDHLQERAEVVEWRVDRERHEHADEHGHQDHATGRGSGGQ